MAQVDEVAAGVYRISQFVPKAGITYNQFLIADEDDVEDLSRKC